MITRAANLALLCASCLIMTWPAACGHGGADRATGSTRTVPTMATRPSNQGPRPVELDPVRIEASSGRVLVPRDLFEKGLALLKAGRNIQAARTFGRIPRLFPHWAGRWSAHFNEAVALERAKRFVEAAKHYKLVGNNSPDQAERLDASVRLALCLARTGRASQALAILGRILDGSETDDAHFLDAACAAGRVHIQCKEFDDADRVLKRGLELARLSAHPKRLEAKAAKCAYWYARSAEARMKALKLRLPVARLEQALLDKSNLFTKARRRYFKVLDHGQAGWSALALERLAAMFEAYFWEVLRAPLPPFGPVLYYDGRRRRWRTLSPKLVVRRYVARLKRNLRSAMRLAIRIYERQLDGLATAGWSKAVLAPARRRMVRFARLVDRIGTIPVGQSKTRSPPPQAHADKSPTRKGHRLTCPFRPLPTGLGL